MNTGRLTGVILVVVGFGITIIAGLWLASQVADEQLESGGALIGAGLAFIPIALLVGSGIYLYVKSGQAAEKESVMQQQRKLLDIVRSRGQVKIHDVALEMGMSVDTIRDMVHDLVGLQVFSGYVNWDDGTLYSADANKLRDLEQCKHCGGEIDLAGRGVAVCKFCGTEYFLT